VRLLDTSSVNKNDPNEARSVAAVALRANDLPQVNVEDHVAVVKVWVRRRRDSARARTRIVNQLHVSLIRGWPTVSAAREN
jgi:hypothetical protein